MGVTWGPHGAHTGILAWSLPYLAYGAVCIQHRIEGDQEVRQCNLLDFNRMDEVLSPLPA